MIPGRVTRLLAIACVALVALGGCRTTAPGVYEHAAVAADHPLASAAGVRMLRYGGNAVDAAVATSFCLSVVRPHSCGIGGGGFMVIAFPPGTGVDPVAIDYRETAPAAVGPGYYEALGDERASVDGVRAAGVPGTVAGLLTVHERYGRLTRATVLGPAIRAAERGFVADANYVKAVEMAGERREANPALMGPSDYIWTQLCRSGRVRVGDRITNPQQAYALRVLAAEGPDAFYEGEIADAIAGMMEAEGGAITRADLAAYRPRITTPLAREVAGCDVLTMPPPSSGGIAILQVLGILETRGVAAFAPTDPVYVHEVTNALKHAYADRARWLADPAYATVPVDDLLAHEYLVQLAARYDPERPIAPDDAGSVPPEDGGTSHLCVVDADGMAVACTETVNYLFGSMTSVPGYGFVLNDEMDDFTTRRGQANIYGLIQSDRNLPAPGKRPLSSMSPTIVLRDGAPYLVVGGSGGPRIITGTLQVMLNCWLWDMPPEEAVAAPRFHHQWQPDVLRVEATWLGTAALDRLRGIGHTVEPGGDVGHIQVIRVDPDGLRAASDPRKGGAPNGY